MEEAAIIRPRLILTTGLPGTGKSLIAKAFMYYSSRLLDETRKLDDLGNSLARNGSLIYLGSDDIRDSVKTGSSLYTTDKTLIETDNNGIYTEVARKATYEFLYNLFKEYASGDYKIFLNENEKKNLLPVEFIVVDCTSPKYEQRKKFYDIARSYGISTHVIYATCKREETMERMYRRTGNFYTGKVTDKGTIAKLLTDWVADFENPLEYELDDYKDDNKDLSIIHIETSHGVLPIREEISAQGEKDITERITSLYYGIDPTEFREKLKKIDEKL